MRMTLPLWLLHILQCREPPSKERTAHNPELRSSTLEAMSFLSLKFPIIYNRKCLGKVQGWKELS